MAPKQLTHRGRKWVFFMYHKQANKTAIQSQHMIADALFSLMKRRPFQQITVTEICEEAAIGRKTFYRNFDLKEDVIDFRLDQLREQYAKEIVGMNSQQHLRHHFEFIQAHADLFIALYHNGFHQMSYAKFAVLIPETMPTWTADPVEQEYRSAYIINGIEAIQRAWIERGFAESIDRVVEIAMRAHERQIPIL